MGKEKLTIYVADILKYIATGFAGVLIWWAGSYVFPMLERIPVLQTDLSILKERLNNEIENRKRIESWLEQHKRAEFDGYNPR